MIALYNSIIAKFEEKKQLLIDAGITDELTVDMFYGQPDNPDEFELMLPAVLIDYSIDWEHENIQIDAHVFMEYRQETENFAPEKEAGMKYMKLLNFVRYCLHGLKSEGLGRLLIKSERPASAEFFHYHIISFRAEITGELIAMEDTFINVDDVTAVIDTGSLIKNKPELPVIGL